LEGGGGGAGGGGGGGGGGRGGRGGGGGRGGRGARRGGDGGEGAALREQTDARVQPPRLQVGDEREHRALGAPALERREEEQHPRRRVRLLRHQGVTVAHEDSRSRELLVERFELASRDLPREGVTNVLTTAGGERRGTLWPPAKLLDCAAECPHIVGRAQHPALAVLDELPCAPDAGGDERGAHRHRR